MLRAIIGDVHGCADEYAKLLDELDCQFPGIYKIQLGDLAHKGPDSAACVDMTIRRTDEFILGNHELKHFRWLDWEDRIRGTQKTNPMQHVEEYADMGLTSEQIQWMKANGKIYTSSGDGLCVVHAGVLSSMSRLPSTQQYFQLGSSDQKYYKTLTMTRFEDSRGQMVEMGCETPQDTWWAERYDGRFGFVVYGHQHYLVEDPVEYPNALGIDLGCVYGGSLCAVILDAGVAVETVKIKAARRYREPLKLEK